MAGWTNSYKLLLEEVIQRRDEGVVVPAELQARIDALVYGRMDTVETPAVAVMCGLDTDCNGASVGSIVGAASGRAKFKDDLAGRLNDTIKPAMIGFQEVRMRDLAARTAVQWHRVNQTRSSK